VSALLNVNLPLHCGHCGSSPGAPPWWYANRFFLLSKRSSQLALLAQLVEENNTA
jgi:hypothetical protein